MGPDMELSEPEESALPSGAEMFKKKTVTWAPISTKDFYLRVGIGCMGSWWRNTEFCDHWVRIPSVRYYAGSAFIVVFFAYIPHTSFLDASCVLAKVILAY